MPVSPVDQADRVLTPSAAAFVEDLTRTFRPRIEELLNRRRAAQQRLDSGQRLDFAPETAAIRGGDWRVASIPGDLQDRRVEITGPVDRKMIINALNSGASVFMADFEDANSPTWENVIGGQANPIDAVPPTISFTSEAGEGDARDAKDPPPMGRPRGVPLVVRPLHRG